MRPCNHTDNHLCPDDRPHRRYAAIEGDLWEYTLVNFVMGLAFLLLVFVVGPPLVSAIGIILDVLGGLVQMVLS